MFEGFVHPLLAAGAALAAVPLVIHLLNRQRHRPMAWGAMRFVAAAYRRTRRRTRLESLLLLLLRMAGVALLALALARPFTDAEGPLASLSESRRDLVLVLDASASTQYREGVETVFDRILDRAREHLLELDAARGDRARLLLAGRWPRLVAWRSPEEALSVLAATTESTDEPLDLGAAFSEVGRLVEEDATLAAGAELEVRLLTDLQRRSFDPTYAGADASGTSEALDRLQSLGVDVLVEDLGSAQPTPPNLGVTSIEVLGGVLGAGVPAEVLVRVANHGPRLASGVRLALEVDGERRPARQIEVPARGVERVVFPVVFKAAGRHFLEVELAGDGLAFDDRRGQVVDVPPTADVLLVDGAPDEARPENDEVALLDAVLEPLDDAATGSGFRPFRPRRTFPEALGSGEIDLSEYEAIVLANVQSLSSRAVEALEDRVAAGAGLLVSVGDNVAPETYDQRLWSADGTGLLPAELGPRVSVANRRESYYRIAEFDEGHPALAFFADEKWRPLLTEVPVYEFFSSRPHEFARVLARLDDEDASPLLVARDYDRGRVLLWNTTLDRAWTRLPESPNTLVPFAHELLRWASRPVAPPGNVALGAPLVAETVGFPRSPVLVRPDGTRRPVESEATELGARTWRLTAAAEADRRGHWRLELEGQPAVSFAVEADPSEGDLARLDPGELEALHPALRLATAAGEVEADEGAARGELWRWFALAALLAIVLESLWAAWLGHRRRLVS